MSEQNGKAPIPEKADSSGRDLLAYQQWLALETRGPLTTPEEIAKWKREHGIDPDAVEQAKYW